MKEYLKDQWMNLGLAWSIPCFVVGKIATKYDCQFKNIMSLLALMTLWFFVVWLVSVGLSNARKKDKHLDTTVDIFSWILGIFVGIISLPAIIVTVYLVFVDPFGIWSMLFSGPIKDVISFLFTPPMAAVGFLVFAASAVGMLMKKKEEVEPVAEEKQEEKKEE